MTALPRRPSWRKKRWWAAGLLALIAGYPAGIAPVGYGVGRGWISTWAADLYVLPIVGAFGQPGVSAPATALRDYAQWWAELGRRHHVAH